MQLTESTWLGGNKGVAATSGAWCDNVYVFMHVYVVSQIAPQPRPAARHGVSSTRSWQIIHDYTEYAQGQHHNGGANTPRPQRQARQQRHRGQGQVGAHNLERCHKAKSVHICNRCTLYSS